MRIFKILFLSVCLMLLDNQQLKAQKNLLDVQDLSKVNVDAYSNKEVGALYEKMQSMKMSEDDLYRALEEKGLPESEIEKLKKRFIPIIEKQQSKENDSEDQSNKKNQTNEKLFKETPKESKEDEIEIFGAELFTKNSLVFEPDLRIATPSNYVLGPDDEIILLIFGYSEKKHNLLVSPEGDIYVPNVGPINVNGLSIEQATKKIKAKLASTIYQAINTGKTSIQVTLGKIKSIRVTVIGEANKPGTYTVSSLTTLYNLLYLCGGPSKLGSYRNIQLYRENKLDRTADLYSFLLNGNQTDNVLLKEGDLVKIPFYTNRVRVFGNVKRSGQYEVFETEKINDLLNYCGGFNENAYKAGITAYRITDRERIVVDINADNYNNFALKGGDEYFIRKLQDNFSNRVAISGSVLRPGSYELKPNLKLKQLIDYVGGVKEDAFTERVSIFRYFENKMPLMVSCSLDSITKNNVDFNLQKNDSIVIHSIFDFVDSQYVQIDGNIRKPGYLQWRKGITLRDAITASEGVSDFGDSTNIEVSRRLKSVQANQANFIETQSFVINLKAKENNDIVLEPYDLIMVKVLPGIIPQRSVIVKGEVNIPGKYILIKSQENIVDLIKRAGGFKSTADSNSIVIRRVNQSNLSSQEREKLFNRVLNITNDSIQSNLKLKNEIYKNYSLISVNIEDALKYKKSSGNLNLEDGDIINIEKVSNLVKVNGEVYYPTITSYTKGKRAKYYINQAGGFLTTSNKSKVFVVYPNGKTASTKSFLFVRKLPKVKSRSEIFVPQKNNNSRAKISVGEWSVLVSSLAIIGNLIINLKK